MENVKVKNGSRILPQRAFLRTSFWGHISIIDQDICTKFGVYVENLVPQLAEWSMYALLKYPKHQKGGHLELLKLP